MLDYIPQDLKDLPQWCIAAANKAPLYLAYDAQGRPSLQNADVNNREHYTTFENARHIFETWPDRSKVIGIGIVVRKENGLVVFDLDLKPPSHYASPEEYRMRIRNFEEIVKRCDSYFEASLNGLGLHGWVRGNLDDDAGNKNQSWGLEQYDDKRFMITTGRAYKPLPIMPRPEAILMMKQLIGGKRYSSKDEALAEYENAPEPLEDWELMQKASDASDGWKFDLLMCGKWQDVFHPETGVRLYPSQSEADFALINLLAFYTDSNEQVHRLYEKSGLGTVPKDDGRPRDRRYQRIALDKYRSEQAQKRRVNLADQERAAQLVFDMQLQQAESAATLNRDGLAEANHTPDIWPPGVAGQIAHFIYTNSARPIPEISVVAALGLLAGIVGKTFCISNSGLNLYLILVARSAVGKEAIHTGISAFMHALRSREPGAMQFIAPQDFASGPALTKALVAWPSFVNIAGEWGHKLRRIACDERDGPMQQLRRTLTDLYQKSGPQSLAGGIAYSNKEKDVATVSGVAFSMVGETTPGTYYESMSGSMMEDGFLSRFTTVHFDGQRPPLNFNIVREPPKELGDHVAALCTYVIQLMSEHKVVDVQMEEAAIALYRNLEEFCDQQINSTDDESKRQLWNRAALKTLRISAIQAVADNWLQPVITRDQFLWARWLVLTDITKTGLLIQEGTIGDGDDVRSKKLLKLLEEYIGFQTAEKQPPASYAIDRRLVARGIVSQRYISHRLRNLSTFSNHPLKANKAIELTLDALVREGYVCRVPPQALDDVYGEESRTRAHHYHILDLENR